MMSVLDNASIETEELFQESLSEAKLISITGAQDLKQVKYLDLKVDSRRIGFGQLGKYVPALEQLKLNNSHVLSVRDLGTGFNHLTILWMARTELQDLEGLGSLSTLKELYLAFNKVKEIDIIGQLESLELLDLEGNCVSDLEQLEYLALCPDLKNLTLEGNPLDFSTDSAEKILSQKGCNSVDDFRNRNRKIICSILPQVKILDDVHTSLDASFEISHAAKEERPERPHTSCGPAPLRRHMALAPQPKIRDTLEIRDKAETPKRSSTSFARATKIVPFKPGKLPALPTLPDILPKPPSIIHPPQIHQNFAIRKARQLEESPYYPAPPKANPTVQKPPVHRRHFTLSHPEDSINLVGKHKKIIVLNGSSMVEDEPKVALSGIASTELLNNVPFPRPETT